MCFPLTKTAEILWKEATNLPQAECLSSHSGGCSRWLPSVIQRSWFPLDQLKWMSPLFLRTISCLSSLNCARETSIYVRLPRSPQSVIYNEANYGSDSELPLVASMEPHFVRVSVERIQRWTNCREANLLLRPLLRRIYALRCVSYSRAASEGSSMTLGSLIRGWGESTLSRPLPISSLISLMEDLCWTFRAWNWPRLYFPNDLAYFKGRAGS